MTLDDIFKGLFIVLAIFSVVQPRAATCPLYAGLENLSEKTISAAVNLLVLASFKATLLVFEITLLVFEITLQAFVNLNTEAKAVKQKNMQSACMVIGM